MSKRRCIDGSHFMVTGCSNGIGERIALKIAKLGANVTVITRKESSSLAVVEKIKNSFVSEKQKTDYISVGLCEDLSAAASVVKKTESQLGPISVIVNCIDPVTTEDTFLDDAIGCTREIYERTYLVMKAATQRMKERRDGTIVIVCSGIVSVDVDEVPACGAYKFSLGTFAASLFLEVDPYGISLTLALPSDAGTPKCVEESLRKHSENKTVLTADSAADRIISAALDRNFIGFVDMNGLAIQNFSREEYDAKVDKAKVRVDSRKSVDEASGVVHDDRGRNKSVNVTLEGSKKKGGKEKKLLSAYVTKGSDEDTFKGGNGEKSNPGTEIYYRTDFTKFEKVPVKVNGKNFEPKISSFEELNLSQKLLENIRKCGYDKPTPVQKCCIPILMEKSDLIATAQTGSGKTAAFLIPILQDLLKGATACVPGEPFALVVSVTRESANEIHDVARNLTSGTNVKCLSLCGATSDKQLKWKFSKTGAHILVSTFGRLKDFTREGIVRYSSIRFVIFDEVDRMFNQMGFEANMKNIISHPTIPQGRQIAMFSPSFSKDLQTVVGQFLRKDYAFASVGIVGVTSADVKQTFYERKKKKVAKLIEILNETSPKKTVVFVETNESAIEITSALSDRFSVTSVHGHRIPKRDLALKEFKLGGKDVLVATSVATRGINIPDVRHVINYNMPKEIDEYAHRITGCLRSKGKVSTFISSDVDDRAKSFLVKIMKEAGDGVSVPGWLKVFNGLSPSHGGYDGFGGHDYRESPPVYEGNRDCGLVYQDLGEVLEEKRNGLDSQDREENLPVGRKSYNGFHTGDHGEGPPLYEGNLNGLLSSQDRTKRLPVYEENPNGFPGADLSEKPRVSGKHPNVLDTQDCGEMPYISTESQNGFSNDKGKNLLACE